MSSRRGLVTLSWHIHATQNCCLVAKLCQTLCTPMDCSRTRSSVHGISQARILEWVAISFSMGSSPPSDGTCVSWIGRRILYHWATREAPQKSRRPPRGQAVLRRQASVHSLAPSTRDEKPRGPPEACPSPSTALHLTILRILLGLWSPSTTHSRRGGGGRGGERRGNLQSLVAWSALAARITMATAS